MPEGQELVFEGEANESPDWDSGDIIVHVRAKSRQGGFRRQGDQLYWTQPITLEDVCRRCCSFIHA